MYRRPYVRDYGTRAAYSVLGNVASHAGRKIINAAPSILKYAQRAPIPWIGSSWKPFSTGPAVDSGYKSKRSINSYSKHGKNVRSGGFLGIEKKFYNVLYGPTLIGTTVSGGACDPVAPVRCLNAMPLGESEQERLGRKVNVVSLEIVGDVFHSVGSAAVTEHHATPCRIIVYIDKQTNGVQADPLSVLHDVGTATDTMVNLEYQKRFKILKDVRFTIDPLSAISLTTVDGGRCNFSNYQFLWRFPLNMEVNYGLGATADIANVIDNSVHVLALCEENSGIFLRYQSRIMFYG